MPATWMTPIEKQTASLGEISCKLDDLHADLQKISTLLTRILKALEEK